MYDVQKKKKYGKSNNENSLDQNNKQLVLCLVWSLIIRKSHSFRVHQTLKRCLSSCPNYPGIQQWQTINFTNKPDIQTHILVQTNNSSFFAQSCTKAPWFKVSENYKSREKPHMCTKFCLAPDHIKATWVTQHCQKYENPIQMTVGWQQIILNPPKQYWIYCTVEVALY